MHRRHAVEMHRPMRNAQGIAARLAQTICFIIFFFFINGAACRRGITDVQQRTDHNDRCSAILEPLLPKVRRQDCESMTCIFCAS